MANPMSILPRSPASLSPGDTLATRLAPLVGHHFRLTGKPRTDGSNLRKLVSKTLAGGSLPLGAMDETCVCVVPKGKGVPKLRREFIDTYIVTTGSSYNLQVWNRNPSEPTLQIEYADGSQLRANDVRFVFGRVDLDSQKICSIVVATPMYVVEHFGKFGKPTIKEQLIIRDVDGRMRMVMLVAQDGPNLLFYDERERVRASLGFEGDDARLELIGRDGRATWRAPPADDQDG